MVLLKYPALLKKMEGMEGKRSGWRKGKFGWEGNFRGRGDGNMDDLGNVC